MTVTVSTLRQGCTFASLVGDLDGPVTGSTTVIRMDKPRRIGARYAVGGSHTVTTVPTGLSVNVDGTVFPAPVAVTWDAGSMHTLTAVTPQVVNDNTQYTFTTWSPGGQTTPAITTAAPATPATYTANYAVSGYRLRLTVQASGGGPAAGCTGSLTPPLPAGGFYAPNAAVTVRVTAVNLWTFASITGTIPTTTNQQVTVKMNQPHTLVATCNPPGPGPVTVTSSGRSDHD